VVLLLKKGIAKAGGVGGKGGKALGERMITHDGTAGWDAKKTPRRRKGRCPVVKKNSLAFYPLGQGGRGRAAQDSGEQDKQRKVNNDPSPSVFRVTHEKRGSEASSQKIK